MTTKLALLGGTPVRARPFYGWPVIGEGDEERLLQVFRSGKWWYGDKVREFEREFAAFQDAAYGVSCCNGTIALQLALQTVGVGPGDEVLVPAYTFIATASAAYTVNAIPVFVDIDPDTWNMDLDAAETAITPRTRAIMPVHFFGRPVDMDRVNELARRHNLKVVEDAAHCWGSQWRGKGLGAWGDMGTVSLQMSKNLTSGEGGIILTDNAEYAKYARSLSNCGREEQGQWYDHAVIGGNYRLTELQAAVLLGQMTRLLEQTERRAENADYLTERLAQVPGIRTVRSDARVTRRAWHGYGIRILSDEFGGLPRAKFIAALQAEGVPASPCYLWPVYKNRGFLELKRSGTPGQWPFCDVEIDYGKVFCPNAERLCADEAVVLSQQLLLGDRADMDDVVAAVTKIHEQQHSLA